MRLRRIVYANLSSFSRPRNRKDEHSAILAKRFYERAATPARTKDSCRQPGRQRALFGDTKHVTPTDY